MAIVVHAVDFFHLPMRTRFPFRYGIAELVELPHLVVRAELSIGNQRLFGFSSDGLPPKWFTKNAATSFDEDDLPQMLRVIRHAAEVAVDVGKCETFFELWKRVYDTQSAWAEDNKLPNLLVGFGVSLCERAILDGFCRAHRSTLHAILMENRLGIDFAGIRPQLRGVEPCDVIAPRPLQSVTVRHTVGLGDPITSADVVNRPADSLPFTLEENIRHYGLTHFKLKLSGEFAADHQRLQCVAEVLRRNLSDTARFTLDGNEQFRNLQEFRDHWERHLEAPLLRSMFETGLIFVEQPLHRDCALNDSVQQELSDWTNAPPLVIDESDADFSSFPKALELGYSGTSHKNCKGIMKSLTNAATVCSNRRSGQINILSAEDLVNVGPLALIQDLAVVACLGISHVERNGHHFFAGLSQFPADEQIRVQQTFPSLYSTAETEFASLQIHAGQLNLQDVNTSAFGHQTHIDTEQLSPW